MTYNPRKAAQVIAYFALKTGGKTINVLKAVKLVYLADRENIVRCGFPILDEPRVSMKNGPVNSLTYNHIKGEVPPQLDGGWQDFVSDREGHMVGLASASIGFDDLDDLSDAEVETLDAVWARVGGMNQWQLVDYTHDKRNVPEWEDPGAGVKRIPLTRIMAALGVPSHISHSREIESVNSALGFLKAL